MGDLNYRVDESFELVTRLIEEKKHVSILAWDQLTDQRKKRHVFQGFDEAKITFPPTYKFKTGTNTLDEVKKRIPSWCDRVLFAGDISVVEGSYTSHQEILLSDHKPVSVKFNSTLNIGALRQNTRRRSLVQAEDLSTVHKRVTKTMTDVKDQVSERVKSLYGSMSKKFF